MIPARGKLFVRPIETPETLPGGRILLTQTTREGLTAQQAEVVAIGAPAYCVNPDCERCNAMMGKALYPEAFTHPTTTQAGDWVLLAPRCLVETDEPALYCCAQDDVLAVLEA